MKTSPLHCRLKWISVATKLQSLWPSWSQTATNSFIAHKDGSFSHTKNYCVTEKKNPGSPGVTSSLRKWKKKSRWLNSIYLIIYYYYHLNPCGCNIKLNCLNLWSTTPGVSKLQPAGHILSLLAFTFHQLRFTQLPKLKKKCSLLIWTFALFPFSGPQIAELVAATPTVTSHQCLSGVSTRSATRTLLVVCFFNIYYEREKKTKKC